MDTFKAKFPTKGDTWLVLSSILFVINIWAIINILRAVPSWILSRTIWEMIGIISYPLAFALIESLIVLIGLIIVAVILPKKVLRDNFVSMGSLSAILASLGMIITHLYGEELDIWPLRDFGRYLLVLIGIVLLSWIPIYFVNGIAKSIKFISTRIKPLSIAYLVLDILALFVVVTRNI